MTLEPAYDFAAAAALMAKLGRNNITERYLREHIREIPHEKVGKSVRFTETHLREFLEQHTRRPAVARTGPAGGRRRSAA